MQLGVHLPRQLFSFARGCVYGPGTCRGQLVLQKCQEMHVVWIELAALDRVAVEQCALGPAQMAPYLEDIATALKQDTFDGGGLDRKC